MFRVDVKKHLAVVVAQVVTHQTMDREVTGLTPTGSWALFSLFFLFSYLSHLSISGASLVRSFVDVVSTLLIFQE